jgi:16S rRNA (guanine527-N7)-methyltransferase
MTPALLRGRILERAEAANVRVDTTQAERLAVYYLLLERWNQKINLTSLPLSTASDAALDRLLIEPLVAAPDIENGATSWFDFGTGGGSPALPLKIMRPAANLTMVEAKERKAAFLREAVRTLDLKSAAIKTTRIEALAACEKPQSVDVVTIRAVRLDEDILATARSLLKLHGRLLLFSGVAAGRALPGFVSVAEQNLSAPGGILARFQRTT